MESKYFSTLIAVVILYYVDPENILGIGFIAGIAIIAGILLAGKRK